ncbi:hypothetical protein ACJMK2_030993 [Sinanodonta woodiana]|uniref:Uncharacterized protein n=1 Tax=Sinanodonta woodiana TaxID=1069815 RepID=A0ABD3X0V9_SINWO
MKRDAVPTKAELKQNVTHVASWNNSYSTENSVREQTTVFYSVSELDLHNTSYPSQVQNQNSDFYNTYNPDIGLHTASVLGGILCFLVIYLIYRTKCRKAIIRGFDRCIDKMVSDNDLRPDSPVIIPDDSPVSEIDGENMQNSDVLNLETEEVYVSNETNRCVIKITTPSSAEEDCSNENQFLNPTPQNCKPEEEHVPECKLVLPDGDADSERATAQWVQDVQKLDKKEMDSTGIILKVLPDLLLDQRHGVRIRQHASCHSISDSTDEDEHLYYISRNTSLPLLLESRGSKTNYYRYSRQTFAKADKYPDCLNDFDNDLEKPQVIPKPHQLHIRHQSGSTVPLDICPIVKIRHHHPRSKRRQNSFSRTNSQDSTSTDSSIDPLLVKLPQNTWQKQMQTRQSMPNEIRSSIHSDILQKVGNNNINCDIFTTNNQLSRPCHNISTAQCETKL